MRQIDIEHWARREHYHMFTRFDHPNVNMCANVDLTAFYRTIQQHNINFTIAMLYLVARTANDIPEFRYRLRPEGVIEHEVVHPSSTILVDGEIFAFCDLAYDADFPSFAVDTARRIAAVKENPSLRSNPAEDERLYITPIPWVTFTSFTHPISLDPPDSVPRFAWGKYFWQGESLLMPLSVQGHHAVMDGLHVGRYYERIQYYLNQPERYLC